MALGRDNPIPTATPTVWFQGKQVEEKKKKKKKKKERKVLSMDSTENRSRSIYTARKIQMRTGKSTRIPVQ